MLGSLLLLLLILYKEPVFWNCDYLDDYIKAPDSKKPQYPGHAYFEKINQFIAAHYSIEELFQVSRKVSTEDLPGQP